MKKEIKAVPMRAQLTSEEDLRMLNLSTALRLGEITWTQYFELAVYGVFKIEKPETKKKAA